MVSKAVPFQSLLLKKTLWLILFSAVVISFTVGYMAWSFQLLTVRNAIRSIAEQASNSIIADIQQTLQLLNTVNDYARSGYADRDVTEDLLKTVKGRDIEKYIEVALLDPAGTVIESSIPDDEKGSYESEIHKWYHGEPDFVISDIIIDREVPSYPSVVIIIPNFQQSKIVSYLMAKISLRGLWYLFDPNDPSRISFSRTGSGMLVNQDFQIIAHADASKVFSHEVLPVQDQVDSEQELQDGEIDNMFFSMKNIPLSGEKHWWLVVTLEKSEVYDSAFQTVATTLIILFIVTVVLLYYTTRAAKNLSKPIQNLCSGTKLISEGDFSYRINHRTNIQEAIELQDHFNDMASKLQDTLDKLTKADRLAALGTMASIVAHEIRNPLSSIVSFSIPLKKRVDENDYEFVNDFDEVVPRELDRLNGILNDFLDFARPQSFEFDEMDINELISDTVRLMEVGLKRNQVIQTTFDSTIPKVRIDKKKLRQVLLNLGKNGLEANNEEKTVVTFSTAFENRLDAPEVVIRVADNGSGIPDKIKGSLFEPFQTTKRKGTGLGLAICQRIVEEHGGTIEVESTGSTGTVFKITLYIKEEDNE